jgi:cytochrome c oxidase assembly protein subunit 11
MYALAIFVSMLGVSYAAVPLYRIFCASTGYSGTPVTDNSRFAAERLVPDTESRRIKITFESNTSDALQWSFKPELREVRVVPGETALTFYRAKNNAKEDIVGIATYNVTPYRAGQYFNKIQCFCFEEQMLRAGEEVDMPVFFFIDPDFNDDPYMKEVNTITLSYTLFNAKYAKGVVPGQRP